MRFATLASGSKGNATLIEHSNELVLVDCGLSLRETKRRLDALGVSQSDLTAILITHEHGDHCRGLDKIVRDTGIIPYMSAGTAKAKDLSEKDYHKVRADSSFSLSEQLSVKPLTVPHDANEPVMYSFFANDAKLCLATDIGVPNEYLAREFASANAILLECNYDLTMLADNINYPEVVKQRIRGNYGHLGNEQAAELLARISHIGLRTVVAAHLSEKNNKEQLALRCLSNALRGTGCNPSLHAATQAASSQWFEVTPAANAAVA